MAEYLHYTLKNGLRIVHLPIKGNVSYCGFIVKAGTRDEDEDEYGMAHFVEHMLFKGTTKRRSHHIINRMESVGGDLNAYTNKEETVIYSSFLEEHFSRAFELLADLTFNSTFPQSELEKEIDVVIDEINSYEDSPSELIYDEFENIVFKNSQIGHNILGEADILKGFNTEKARKFAEKHYVPENVVFFSLGKTDFKKIIYQTEKYLHDINNKTSGQKRISSETLHATRTELDKDTTQTHALIGSRCYDLYDNKRRSLRLLNNILGGPGMNSRLNISLREKRGYVYNVESSMTNYQDTGLFAIYFGCDKKNTEKCISLINKELQKFRDVRLTSSQLSAAKKQLIGQIAVASDNNEYLALGLGKSFLLYNHLNGLDETIKNIDSITSEDVLEVANDILRKDGLNYLIYS